MKRLKILVCGSRDFADPALIRRMLEEHRPTVVIHGAARGADVQGGIAAKFLGVEQVAYQADWNRYGRAAGSRRNVRMLDEAQPDLVLAFFAGRRTAGTDHTVTEAKKRGIPVEEYGL